MFTTETPIWQLTVGEFQQVIREAQPAPQVQQPQGTDELIEGIEGLAKLLKCGKTKAQEISRSGIIEAATYRTGRVLRFDGAKALELIQAADAQKNKPNFITKKQ